jgi:hypothetical protein
VELSHAERTELRALLSGGKQEARKLKRAQIEGEAARGSSQLPLRTMFWPWTSSLTN